MAPQVLVTPRDPAHKDLEVTVDNRNSTAPRLRQHPSTAREPEDQDHPHTCNNGGVTLGQIAFDEETGEEVEEFAMYLCRRCSEAAGETL